MPSSGRKSLKKTGGGFFGGEIFKNTFVEKTDELDSENTDSAEPQEVKELKVKELKVEKHTHGLLPTIVWDKNINKPSRCLSVESAQVVDYISQEFEAHGKALNFRQFETAGAGQLKVQKKIQSVASLFWIVIILSSVGAGGFWLFTHQKKILQNQKVNLKNKQETATASARVAFDSGDYAESLSLFKIKELSEYTQPQDLLSYVSLLVRQADESYLYGVEDRVENALDQLRVHEDKEISARALILRGIMRAQDKEWLAALSLFNQAQDEMENPELTLIHKMMVSLISQNTFPEEQFLKIQDKNPTHLSLFLAAYGLLWKDDELANSLLEELISKGVDYAQEASFVSLYAKVMSGSMINEDELTAVKQVLDFDPYLTAEHRYDILSYSSREVWSQVLMPPCKAMYEKMGTSKSYSIALYAFCQAQAGLLSAAEDSIQTAIEQSPRDALILSLDKFISLQSDEGADISFDRVLTNNKNFVLPYILRARFCGKKADFKCAEEYWNKAAEIQSSSLSVQAGRAEALYSKGQIETAQPLLEQGLNRSPSYIPLLRLNSVMK